MKTTRSILIASLLFMGCGQGKKTYPSERLQQPAGISYVTPDGWYRSSVPGIEHIIVFGSADSGLEPCIYVDGVSPANGMEHGLADLQHDYQSNYDTYMARDHGEFSTVDGVRGVKAMARRLTSNALPVSLIHYLFFDEHQMVRITCSCAESAQATYEPIFDIAMKSVKLEERNP